MLSNCARLAAIFAISSIAIHAQPSSAPETIDIGIPMPPASMLMRIGPYMAGGASLHVEPVYGETTAPVAAWRFGAAITFPLTRVASASLGVGYDTRGVDRISSENSYLYSVTRVGYLTFTPGFTLRSFWFGLNLGVPMSASVRSRQGVSAAERDSALDDDAFAKIEYMVEPRIGAVVPVIDDDAGMLSLTFDAGFTLNELSLGETVPVEESNRPGSYHMISAHLGLAYQFPLRDDSH